MLGFLIVSFCVNNIFTSIRHKDIIMELSFKELAKRDVINVADGKCLGRIVAAAYSGHQHLV